MTDYRIDRYLTQRLLKGFELCLVNTIYIALCHMNKGRQVIEGKEIGCGKHGGKSNVAC